MLLATPSDAAFESICLWSLSCCVLALVQSCTSLEFVPPSDNSSTFRTRHSPLAPLPTVLPMTACLSATPHAILPASKATHFHWNPSVNTQQHSNISDEYYFLGCDIKYPARNLPTFRKRRKFIPKRRQYPTILHGVMSHKTAIFISPKSEMWPLACRDYEFESRRIHG
jgi:hypothetical protein